MEPILKKNVNNNNNNNNYRETPGKVNKYPQLAFEVWERKHSYRVEILVPIVTGYLGGGMKQVQEQVEKIIQDENATN